MAHFGVLSYKGAGHMNPLIALSKRLKSRGHKVTFFQTPEVEDRVRLAGLNFCPLGKTANSSSGGRARVNNMHSTEPSIYSLRQNIRRVVSDMESTLKEAPLVIAEAGIDALIINEIILSGPTLAQLLQLPYFAISTSVPHNFGWTPFSSFSGGEDPISHFDCVKNAALQLSMFKIDGPIGRKLDDFRRDHGMGPIREIQNEFPPLAHITQLPACLDFPRSTLPNNFYYAGPFVDETARPFVDFPWSRLDGRPFIYASLGTVKKNGHPSVFRFISEACKGVDLQLVISLGDRHEPESGDDLPGDPLVVRYAPQLELLKRARLVITHGGPNTVFEALMEGKPMIAIPMAHDQPAIADRLAWLNVAEVLPIEKLSAERLRLALEKLLSDASYSDAAMKIGAKIRSEQGLERAVDVIEVTLRATPLTSEQVPVLCGRGQTRKSSST